MVIEHQVREHSRDDGETHVDEYERGKEKKVGRFSGTFKGLSGRFKERQEEYERSKEERDIALSREEYIAQEEKNEATRLEFEREAYEKTHKAPLRQRLASTARKGYAAYQMTRGPAPRTSSGRRSSSSSRVPPGYAVYNGKLYRIPKGYAATPAPRRRRRSKPGEDGIYGENDMIYR